MEALISMYSKKNRCRISAAILVFFILFFFSSCEVFSPFSFANSLKSNGFTRTFDKEINITQYLDDGYDGFMGIAVTSDSLWILTYKSVTELDPVSLALKNRFVYSPALDYTTFKNATANSSGSMWHVSQRMGLARYQFLRCYSNGSGQFNYINIVITDDNTSNATLFTNILANAVTYPMGTSGAIDFSARYDTPAYFRNTNNIDINFPSAIISDTDSVDGFYSSDTADKAYYVSNKNYTANTSSYSVNFTIDIIERSAFNSFTQMNATTKQINVELPKNEYSTSLNSGRLHYSLGKGGALVTSRDFGDERVGVAILAADGVSQLGSVLFSDFTMAIAGDAAWYALFNLGSNDSGSENTKYPSLRRYVWGKP